jgi:lactoylglutathione lyase
MTRLGYAIVMTSSMDRSVAFYRDVLGFPVKFSSPEWTEFVSGGTTLALHPAASSIPESAPPGGSPAGRCELAFWVEDLDAFHGHLTSRAVPCVQPPQDMHGVRLAVYSDPDGLTFSVGQHAAPTPSESAPSVEGNGASAAPAQSSATAAEAPDTTARQGATRAPSRSRPRAQRKPKPTKKVKTASTKKKSKAAVGKAKAKAGARKKRRR